MLVNIDRGEKVKIKEYHPSTAMIKSKDKRA